MTEELDPETNGKIILKNSEYRKWYVASNHSVGKETEVELARAAN
jgi:hypothetical protein